MTIRIDRSQLPDDLDSRPTLKAFYDSLIQHETMGGSDTNTLVTSIARALDDLETRLIPLEAEEGDDGGWEVLEEPSAAADSTALLAKIVTRMENDLDDLSNTPDKNELRDHLRSVTTAVRELAQYVADNK